MAWAEVFVVLVVSHLVGDFALQTEWQASHKHGGLGRDPLARRALLHHVLTYTLAFVPALVWIAERGDGVWVAVAALVALPHLVQDDGRLLTAYIRTVKHSDVGPGDLVYVGADQTFHVVVLLLTALVVAG